MPEEGKVHLEMHFEADTSTGGKWGALRRWSEGIAQAHHVVSLGASCALYGSFHAAMDMPGHGGKILG